MSKDLSDGLLQTFPSVEKLQSRWTFYNAHPMIPTRRTFLQTGSAMLGMGMAHGSLPSSADEPTLALPPSIAALKSMKDQARPIRPEERLARQEKARSLMEANGLDAILLMEGTSLNYFTGIRWWGGERLFAMVLPAKGTAFYVCPAFEEGRAREQIAQAPEGAQVDLRIWQEDESPYQRVAQGLKDRNILTGKIGVEETVRFVFREGLEKAAPQAKLVSATPVTAGCRMIKSAAELDLMRLANQVTLTAYEAVYRGLHDGVTQIDVGRWIEAAHEKLGFEGEALVEVGEFSAFPHGSTQPQVIREGLPILIDGGCKVEGYQSDITRTFVLGSAPDKVKKVFDVVHRAQSAALAAARPGDGVRRGGCGGTQSHHGCGLWSGLQVLHASRGTWYWHGWTRVALSGARERDQTGAQHDVQR